MSVSINMLHGQSMSRDSTNDFMCQASKTERLVKLLCLLSSRQTKNSLLTDPFFLGQKKMEKVEQTIKRQKSPWANYVLQYMTLNNAKSLSINR